jgi:molecular chaperone GrpE (heat shock protein)
MIQNDRQLESTREALLHLEAGMAALYKDKAKMHPDQYTFMVEPFLEELLNLRQQIDDYLGVTDAKAVVSEYERKMGSPPSAEDLLSLHPSTERI